MLPLVFACSIYFKLLLFTPLTIFKGEADAGIIKSDNVSKIISVQPNYIPSKEAQIQARAYLAKIFGNKAIAITQTKEVAFIDQGENFESVRCNICNKVIANELWQSWMEKADRSKFANLSIKTECCHKVTSLNNLKYDGPAGFAKFIISITNSNLDITNAQLLSLERILKTKLRLVEAHY